MVPGKGVFLPEGDLRIMTKFAFLASNREDAQNALRSLEKHYNPTSLEEAEIIVVLGGDGFMLRALHQVMDLKKPVFGMNCGSVGFLMNPYHVDDLEQRLEAAKHVHLSTLHMKATSLDGKEHEHYAINEVSLFRSSALAGHLKITVDGQCHLEELVCDGVLLSTPAGSTAYNLSAHGPILPLKSNVLALTPISAFRPRRWKGALLSHDTTVTIDVIHPEERPLSAVADFHEIPSAQRVAITSCPEKSLTLLFDPESGLENRILKEQFLS